METKLKTVQMSERGILVIPEEVRKDLGVQGGATFVLIESGNEIILKKESDVVNLISSKVDRRKEDIGWMILAQKSLEELWNNPKDEEVWKKYL